MRNLKVWQKLALLGLVLLIPFIVVMWKLVASINTLSLAPAHLEVQGVEYMAPVRKLMHDVQLHRAYSQAAVNGDATARERSTSQRQAIEEDIRAVDEVNQKLGSTLNATQEWQTVKAKCAALLQKAPTLSPRENIAQHNALVAEIIKLIQHVGDTSTLTLDPEMASYYLMNILVFRQPELSEMLSRARAVGAGATARGKITETERKQLLHLAGIVGYLEDDVEGSLHKAFAESPALRSQLEAAERGAHGPTLEYLSRIEALTGTRAGTGAGAGTTRISASEYSASAAQANDANFELSDAIGPALVGLLNERITRLNKEIYLTLFWAILGLAVVSLIGVFLIRDVTRPLRETVNIAEQIAGGDLSVAMPDENRQDELGALTQSFNRMIHSLRANAAVADQIAAGNLNVQFQPQSEKDALGNSLSKMVQNLRSMTGNVSEAVNRLGSSSSQILASISQLTSTATQTASAVSETTTTVEEVRQTAHVSSQKAQLVSQSAQQAAQTSQDGRHASHETSEGMERIREQMDAIAQSMVRLSEQGQAIGEIIASVDDLTQQSNLLAVNAAIEAAKAGEQGKGFAVVAQEVKNLAEQSRQATGQVRTILSDIQKATAAAVMATEQGSKVVEAGVLQSSQAGEAISRLSESIDDAAQAAMQIAASSQQQLVGVDQVAVAMDDVKQASLQNVESARQLETAAHDLNNLGQQLKELTHRYKV